MSYGANAPLFSEIKNSLYHKKKIPSIQSYVFGLGGREIAEKDIEEVFGDVDTDEDYEA